MALKNPPYQGFEQGPIRPPSESNSLLIRITRNCPWNRCTFCFIYKHDRFSIRPVTDVIKDIDTVYRHIQAIGELAGADGSIYRSDIGTLAGNINPDEMEAFHAAVNWFTGGMESVFLQDANSLVMKPDYLVEILDHLKKRFPWVARITSYARSHSLARISDENLLRIKEAGLNRIHVGLETASDELLKLVQKGCTKHMHIKAGLKVKKAGMELSEYVMPGLGGRELSDLHAAETADALNRIDPHFIRLRTLTIPENYQLFAQDADVSFVKATEYQVVQEIKAFIQQLEGLSSTLKSDHMMNLLQAVEGTFPDDKPVMLKVVQDYLDLSPEDRMRFQIGRRFGFLLQTSDLQKDHLYQKTIDLCNQLGITTGNVDQMIDKYVSRSI